MRTYTFRLSSSSSGGPQTARHLASAVDRLSLISQAYAATLAFRLRSWRAGPVASSRVDRSADRLFLVRRAFAIVLGNDPVLNRIPR